MMITCGLGGLYVAVANILLILIGKNYYGSIQVGQSIGLVAFSLMLVVAAFESRREKSSAFSVETFNSPRMNKTAVIEIALAYLITQADFLNKLLGTVSLTFPQWGLALLAAVLLLFLWELGKLIARRSGAAERAATH
jgi:Ca2+-transporting ATPase